VPATTYAPAGLVATCRPSQLNRVDAVVALRLPRRSRRQRPSEEFLQLDSLHWLRRCVALVDQTRFASPCPPAGPKKFQGNLDRQMLS
jgi:hypothetical protein